MFLGTNFARPAGISPAGAAPKEPNVTIIALDDILTWPERDSRGIRMLGSFVLKTGARMYQFYQTISKFKATTESEGDEDAVTNKQKVETEIPGDSLEANEFLATWMGINVVIIFGSCSDDFQKVYGTKCAPLQLKPSSQDDNEARKKMLVFEQLAKSTWFPGHYTGSLVLSAPFAPTTAVFAINATNGNQYQIPALAVTAVIAPSALDLAAGQIVTFIGGGGAGPATLAQTTTGSIKVLLKTGSTWTALVGSVLQLRVFDAGADKYLIEVSRT